MLLHLSEDNGSHGTEVNKLKKTKKKQLKLNVSLRKKNSILSKLQLYLQSVTSF